MISDINFTPVVDGGNNTVAEGSIRLDGKYKVQGVRVIRGTKGLFISWPSFREADIPNSRFPIFEIEDERERWAAEAQILARVTEIR